MTPFHFAENEASDHRRIDVPAGLAGKKELLDFLAKAIPLPAYFGHNWDALEECLFDLDLLTQPKVALIHHDIPLEAAPSDQKLYLQILAKAAQASPRLVVIFPSASRATVEKLLAK